jgi:hypothetical protein
MNQQKTLIVFVIIAVKTAPLQNYLANESSSFSSFKARFGFPRS